MASWIAWLKKSLLCGTHSRGRAKTLLLRSLAFFNDRRVLEGPHWFDVDLPFLDLARRPCFWLPSAVLPFGSSRETTWTVGPLQHSHHQLAWASPKTTVKRWNSSLMNYWSHQAQLSNLWWMPNSVSKGFDTAMKTSSSWRFKRYPTTYMWVSSHLPITED